MGDMLSQEEINALLGGVNLDSAPVAGDEPVLDTSIFERSMVQDILSNENKDILGEIGNISMGTSATTLFALLGQKVWITTPKVNVLTWKDLSEGYVRPCVGIRVNYKEGLKGSNILILKQRDVKIIANLMMGGDGLVGNDVELNDIDLSAIGEAMNQMVGSSSTSLSSMVKMKIDIDTPNAFILDFSDDNSFFENVGFAKDDIIACTSFKMEIGTLIDSEIMQILPLEFARDMIEKLKSEMFPGLAAPAQTTPAPAPVQQAQPAPMQQQYQQPPMQQQPVQPDPMQQQYQQPPMQQQYQQPPMQQQYQQPPMQQQYQQPPMQPQYQQPDQMQYQQPYGQPGYGMPQNQMYGQQMPQNNMQNQHMGTQPNINVKPAEFNNFDIGALSRQKENIDIIMDVPLEVTVELGRTRKKIKDILEFIPGTIVELDKIAGEPIDILVNGKYVARGEVVVIDENFGIRITDIISVEKRI